ncbi:hypothetical protein GQ53DRAFT_766357 [Thozetella sp. PMI_491]|nr:hypothetical protein GQ53DRAFT_766357 [Thozetella sp. PMI_491]
MNGGVCKAWTRRSRVRLSKALQETLLDAVASSIPGTELPQNVREQSLESGVLAGDATHVQARKRRLDATDSDLSPAKRTRLTRTETQQSGVEDEKAEQADEPRSFKHPYALFLEDFVDPVHPNPTSVHTFVSEWLESIGSDREKECRSDSHLQRSDGDFISRQLTRSAPEMSYRRDAGGFVVPPTPASTKSRSYRSYQATEDSASSTASVRHPSYRQNNLTSNGIHVRHDRARLPDHISSHVEELRAKQRDSPSPTSEQIDGYLDELGNLAEGCTEADVEGFLEDSVFPKPSDATYGRSAGLGSAKSSLMSSHLIPNNPESQFRVSGPKPDLLYGYSGALRDGAFTQAQFLAQEGLHPRNARFAEATTQGLRFPFFAIEIKAAGGTRGDLWVATNQCAGASSACLNAIDQLNTLLREDQSGQRVDNLSYSIAVDNNIAQLYISWKEDDLNYYLQRVDAFLLSRPEDFKSFRKQVRNILDWGKDTHLTQIKVALDTILEENRKKATEQAKSHQPPSDGSATTTTKKRKSSSSRRNSSRSNSVEGPSGGASGAYLEWDETNSQLAHAEPSYPPQQLQGFVDTGDYTTLQDTDEGLDLHEYHYPEDEQQDHGPALASFGLATEQPASFVTDPSTEEQPAAATDGS